jgi:non-specific serine/threonine protein kinase
MLDQIAALVEKNLLVVDDTDQETPRFTMLRTIWEFAEESLIASGEEQSARACHAAYFASFAEREEVSSEVDAHDSEIQRDADNLRAALRWAIGTRQPALGLRLAVGLGRYWYMRGYAVEGERWISELLAMDAQSGLSAAPRLRLGALYAASRFAMDRRDFDSAESLAREGIAIAERSVSSVGTANMLATLGHVAEARGERPQALEFFERSLEFSRQAHDAPAIGRALSSLGNLARTLADYSHATAYLEESVAVARTLHMSWGVANGLTSLGHVACEQGMLQRATAYYRESLRLYADLGNEQSIAWTLEGVVVLCAHAGAYQRAAMICGAITRAHGGASVGEGVWLPYAQASTDTRAALSPAEWEQATASDGAFSIADAVTTALAALA